ncbi:hypothetical protein NW768_004819 [Fusarium equiseti]|uniref:Uncharacterized protein n=1 Tax=Fusarium equiseti TaxID=61235 RepID=A0ABQ8RHA6_FUSEQ|nr:hypothetical protein NW768_004819 [Fusarium equiseti]
MSKRNHDEFLDRNTSEMGEEMVMDALIQQTIQRIANETGLLARQKRTAFLYKKRALLKEEYNLVMEEMIAARTKHELLMGQYMSDKESSLSCGSELLDKATSWYESTDEFVRKASQLYAKSKELQSVLKEIESLKEEDTKSQTSGAAQEPSTTSRE